MQRCHFLMKALRTVLQKQFHLSPLLHGTRTVLVSPRRELNSNAKLFTYSSLSPENRTVQSTEYEFSRIQSSKEQFIEYRSTFMEMINELEKPEKEQSYFKMLLTYNLFGGKNIRGALVAASMEAFAPNEQHRSSHARDAHLIGWCIELLHAGFLVLDDIVDNSPTRRGQPSWYRVQQDAGHGLNAVNDGLHLILTSKSLLHKILSPRPEEIEIYLKILRLFDQVAYKTCCGQHLDNVYSQNDDVRMIPEPTTNLDLRTFTVERFELITQWKTGFYTFCLPIACGMALAGVKDDKTYDQAEKILLKLGLYFQAQDDFLDCYGDIKATGKEGTDIVDGKCCWPIVECLTRASETQIRTIEEHYGRKDPQSKAAVLRVYEELDLRGAFRQYEEALRAEIVHDISAWNPNNHVLASPSGPRDLFTEISQLLFRRTC